VSVSVSVSVFVSVSVYTGVQNDEECFDADSMRQAQILKSIIFCHLHSTYTMALTFENFFQDAVMHPSSRNQFRKVHFLFNFFIYFLFLTACSRMLSVYVCMYV